MAVVLVYLTGLFVYLPQPLLAALVLASVNGHVPLRRAAPAAAREQVGIHRSRCSPFSQVLTLGILRGVLVAAIFSLAMLIRRLAQPECAVLGRFPGTSTFAAIMRHPEARPIPGVLIVRPNAALLYFNAETVREEMEALIRRAPAAVAARHPRPVVFEPGSICLPVRMLAEAATAFGGAGNIVPHRRSAHITLRRAAVSRRTFCPCLATCRRLSFGGRARRYAIPGPRPATTCIHHPRRTSCFT
jgi:hypothetical protein